jgi:5'(3')-deoxyribonucleotidase
VILIDVDETVAELRVGLQAALQARGLVKEAKLVAEAKGEEVPAEVEALSRLVMEQPGFFLGLEPIPGAVETVAALAHVCDVVFCTSPIRRSISCPGEKLAWIEKHFGFSLARSAIITKDKWRVHADWLIDDRIQPTRGASWQQIQFVRPWSLPDPETKHISSWLDKDALARMLNITWTPPESKVPSRRRGASWPREQVKKKRHVDKREAAKPQGGEAPSSYYALSRGGERSMAFSMSSFGEERFGASVYNPDVDGDKSEWTKAGGEWWCDVCAAKEDGFPINWCRRDAHCWKCLTPRPLA